MCRLRLILKQKIQNQIQDNLWLNDSSIMLV